MIVSLNISALYPALKPKREYNYASDIYEHVREKVINISPDQQKNT